MQNAEILPLHRPPTWDDVGNEYAKLFQKGWEAVVQAAKVGQMLIELKAQCAEGEFLSNVKHALHASRMTANTLMRIAANMPLLEKYKPESQRAAIALITTKEKSTPPSASVGYRVGWVALLTQRLGLTFKSTKHRAKEIREKLGDFPMHFTSEDDANAFVERYVRVIGLPEGKPSRAELTAMQAQKLDTAIRVERVRLEKDFEQSVDAEVRRRCEIREASYDALEEKAREREAQASAAMAGFDSYMSRDEFSLILNCLHPDRAPEDRRERFAKAFGIFKRMETHINRGLSLAILRARGWGR